MVLKLIILIQRQLTEPNIKDLDKTQSQEIITEQELARTCNHKFAIKLFKNLLIKTGIPGDYASYNKLLEQKYSGKISDDLLKKLKNTIKEKDYIIKIQMIQKDSYYNGIKSIDPEE